MHKFFYWVANWNRRNNCIESLSVNDLVSFDQYVIGEHIVQFYDSLF
jgi:hypothetical protein